MGKPKIKKVMAGVVGRPAERRVIRWKPFTAQTGAPFERPNSPVSLVMVEQPVVSRRIETTPGDCAGESSSQRRESPLQRKSGLASHQVEQVQQIDLSDLETRKTCGQFRVVPRRLKPFVPEWMKGFLFRGPRTIDHGPCSTVDGQILKKEARHENASNPQQSQPG